MPDRTKDIPTKQAAKDALSHPFTSAGRLASGLHDYTLPELRALVATTPYRRQMWNRFIAFMTWPILDRRFSHAYLGGGFASETPRPRDIDLILQPRARYGPEVFHVLESYFRVGLETIQETFSVHLHFWIQGAPPGFCDYKVFFQYGRPEKKRDFDRQGLIRIDLSAPGLHAQLREMLGGFELTDDHPGNRTN